MTSAGSGPLETTGAPCGDFEYLNRLADASARIARLPRTSLSSAGPEIVKTFHGALDVRLYLDSTDIDSENDPRRNRTVIYRWPTCSRLYPAAVLTVVMAKSASSIDVACGEALARQIGARLDAVSTGAAFGPPFPENPGTVLSRESSEILRSALTVVAESAIGPATDARAIAGAAIVGWNADLDGLEVVASDSDRTSRIAETALPDLVALARATREQDSSDTRITAIPCQLATPAPLSQASSRVVVRLAPMSLDERTPVATWLLLLDAGEGHDCAHSPGIDINTLTRLVGLVASACSDADRQRALTDEVSHRVRNNLLTLTQIIDDLSRTGSGRSSLDAVREWIVGLIGVYSVLETDGADSVEVRSLARKLTDLLLAGWPDVTVNGEVAILDGRQGSVLGLVLAELLQNVRKHAYASDGKVRVTVDSRPGGLTLIVEDWGVGLTDARRSSGRGTGLVRRLLSGIGGSVTIVGRPSPNSGTIATVSLPAVY